MRFEDDDVDGVLRVIMKEFFPRSCSSYH
jgi:hypothetical protein